MKKNKKKIFVTGASGFIGRHLVSKLGEINTIIAPNSSELDLTDSDMAIDYAKHLDRIDVIIHLASRLISKGEEKDMSVLYDNNKITESVALIAKQVGCDKFINFSSMAVYPNISGKFSENSPTGTSGNTECIYGLSKICAENLFDFLLKGTVNSIIHLRLAQVFGERMREDRIISIMKRELKETNKITVFGDGERTSNFININSVVETVEMILETETKGVYNLGEEQLSYYELAEKIIKENGKEGSKIEKKGEGSRAKFVLDISKLNNLKFEMIKK